MKPVTIPKPARRTSPQRAVTKPTLSYRVATTKPSTHSSSRTFAWVHRAGKANIGSFVIAGGLFYVGSDLAAIDTYRGAEPSLVNPKLPIDFSKIDWSGDGLHYWPSYDRLSPGERAAYVSWLASPRDSPSTPIGYVFLYFYGLERRVLIDLSPLKDVQDELKLIADEVRRLRTIYNGGGSFAAYSADFLAILDFLLSPNDVASEAPPQIEGRHRDAPPLLKFGLGRFAHEGVPVPTAWAFEWAKVMPNAPTLYSRCPNELEQLFAIRYKEKFGAGIVLKPLNNEAKCSYRPASASFGGDFQFTQAVPDVSLLTSQAREIEDLLRECHQELSAYSRYIARHPEGKESLAAVALLPTALVTNGSSIEVANFVKWTREKLGASREVIVDGVELVSQWPASNPDRLAKHEAVAMAELLATFGLGFEPDVRFSGPVVGPGNAVLFNLGTSSSVPGPGWASASAVLHMTAAIISASASNEVLLEQVVDQLQNALQLDIDQHNRIRAHLLWASSVKLSIATTKRSLAVVNTTTKKHIGEFLIDVAATSGELGPKQVSALTTAFKILDLEPNTIYSLLHERSTGAATEPVEVRSARPAPIGEAIPPKKKVLTADKLNKDLIAAKLAESARATSLLGEIFADSNDEEERLHTQASTTSKLNYALRSLAEQLGRQTNWTNEEFAKLAKACGLLPNGAVENLNDFALDKFGEPLLEGGQGIEVNQSILEEILS